MAEREQGEQLPSLSEYSPDQWWFKELEKIWTLSVGEGVTHDMKRAAHIAMHLATSIEKAQTVLTSNVRLRKALEGVIGASDPKELKGIRDTLDAVMPPDSPERVTLFAAIDTLLEIPNA